MAPKRSSGRNDDRVTYRDLRNTPARVWKRLASHELLTLVAEGEAKAILIPVEGGDVRSAQEAYVRGRAMLALAHLRRQAREAGADRLTLSDINALIKATRDERRRAARRT